MKLPTHDRGMRVAVGSTLLALMSSLSGPAAVYSFNDAGPVPQAGTSLSFEHVLTGDPCAINSLELVLTFSSGWHLNGSSINGALILDPSGMGATTTYEAFSASVSSSGTSGQQIYDITFPAGGKFSGCNPNGIWALNLWDKSADGIENNLVSWSLEPSVVTSVPEPVDVALPIVAAVWVLATAARSRPVATGWPCRDR